MQKIELLKTIQDFRTGKIDYGVVLTAVEQREQALLQQYDCSMLRELLALKLKDVQQQMGWIENHAEYISAMHDENALQRVLSLINDMKPVA